MCYKLSGFLPELVCNISTGLFYIVLQFPEINQDMEYPLHKEYPSKEHHHSLDKIQAVSGNAPRTL